MSTNQNTANGTINIGDYTAPSNDDTYSYQKRYQDYCPHRLPCGYCKLLMRDCPKGYTTTWTVTC